MNQLVEVDLKQIFQVCLKKIWLILLSALVLGVAVYMYTVFFVTPQYVAKASFYVNNSAQFGESQKISSSDLATAQRLVLTYVNIIKSETVLEKVIDEAELDMTPAQIREIMAAESVDETELFEVQISHPDPYVATRIVNAIADVAPNEISGIMVGSTTKVIDRAKVPTKPSSPNVTKSAVIGALAGAVLAVAAIAISVLMDVRIKSEEDLLAISAATNSGVSVPVLGVIPDFYDEGPTTYAAYRAEKAGRR